LRRVTAALEGALSGIPSIAVSVEDSAAYEQAAQFAATLAIHGFPATTLAAAQAALDAYSKADTDLRKRPDLLKKLSA
jgi:broad specificity polyphosphatase/5'/3'-nucleotidase SurE